MSGATFDRRGPAARSLALACVVTALGGLLLGLQVDGNGDLSGTGFVALGVGGVVALAAELLGPWSASTMPRDALTALSTAAGFLGLAFVVAGVLAPGGSWMFAEVLLLIAVLARSRAGGVPRGSIALLALLFVLRLWIAYQGSEHRWQLATIEVPIVSSIPLKILEPIQRVDLGQFTPDEMGFPRAGLAFGPTLALWSAGFALAVAGLAWRARAALEHENDRIHATIQDLPPNLARLVERLIPEDRWGDLGLHGLSDRRLRKKLEQIFAERIAARSEIERALGEVQLLSTTNPGGFAGELYRTIETSPPRFSRPSNVDET
jgi:hypothetical protein